jgi:endonuclease/exonuclease/phosphatase family metal-dependent hydrolase
MAPQRKVDHLALVIGLTLVLVTGVLVAGMWRPARAATLRPLVVTSQNVRVTLGPTQARHDVTAAAAGADLVMLQEFNHRRAVRFTPVGFSTWQGPWGPRAETPLMWRTSSLSLLAARTVLLHRSQLFPSATRYATVARFSIRRSGHCLLVVNVHLVPHIEKSGYLTHAPRAALVRRAMAVIAGLARGAPRCTALVGGDWNVDYWRDARVRQPAMPYATMRAVGYRAQWSALRNGRPTLGRRYVDTLWSRHAGLAWQQVRGHTYSDHQQVRLGFYGKG